eukprot:gene7491-9206_t
MVQFKNQFLGIEESKFKLVTTSQKCVRAGGKHNDLENVGYTARHHTFFEMLGNFSFGGYKHFKGDAIRHAWQLLTKDIGLPADRLAVSVLHGDEEAADIWKKEIGLPSDRVFYKGKEDNFWSMGDGSGPCGPCSEIFWDHGEGNEVDGDRYLEIWNLVFMQYMRDDKGNLSPLPMPCVDTGMGLERMATVLQGKSSNYEIDLFQNLIRPLKELIHSDPKLSGHINSQDPNKIETACRVVIDHLRSISFLISDGVIPSNVGRGYVLRKIIRRALSYGKILGFNEPFLHTLLPILSNEMGDTYPQLIERHQEITNVIFNEELTFYSVIKRGIPYLDDLIDKNLLNENSLFDLYHTYGLPLEISEVKAKQQNLSIDMEKVQKLIDESKEKSKSSWKGNNSKDNNNTTTNIPDVVLKWKNESIEPKFIGYSTTISENSTILKSHFDIDSDQNLIYLSLDECPFYGNSGGQIGDTGTIVSKTSGRRYQVVNTLKPYDKGLVVIISIDPTKQRYSDVTGDLSAGSKVECLVDRNTRRQTAIHHTATHLLHSALKNVLSTSSKKNISVVQAGSYVGPDVLRFDFTYPSKLLNQQIQDIEDWVNKAIESDVSLETVEMPYSEASKGDAIQMFSEKYGDTVRVVQVPGFSKELCGGTHVGRSSDIHHFKIIGESSVAAGTRRIEAVAGLAATQWYANHYRIISGLSNRMNVPVPHFEKSVEKLLTNSKEQEIEICQLNLKMAMLSAQSRSGQHQHQQVTIHHMDCDDKKILQSISNDLCKNQPTHTHLIITNTGKLVCATGSDCNHQVSADETLKQLLKTLGTGKGGGSKQLAHASFGCSLDQNLLQSIYKWANCDNNDNCKNNL